MREPEELDLEIPCLPGAPGKPAESAERTPADGVVQFEAERAEPGPEPPERDTEVVEGVLAERLVLGRRRQAHPAEAFPRHDARGIPGGPGQQVGREMLQARRS